MFTIKQATEIFAALDHTPDAQKASLDKALRNISTRVYLAPKGRDGLANLYDLAGLCALRLIYKATVFGLDRWMLEDFARWLQAGSQRREEVAGGYRLLSPCEEALARIKTGEEFAFHVMRLSDGKLQHSSDWPLSASEQDGKAFVDQFLADAELDEVEEDARFSLPASRLIGALVAAVEEAKR